MKIEDINYTLPTEQIDEAQFDKEKWLLENPVDYFKFIYIYFTAINNCPSNVPFGIVSKTAFDALYRVSRLYMPSTLYKYYSLTNNKSLNRRKLSTLKNKQIYMSDIKEFNDPFDGKAFFYDASSLATIERLKRCAGHLIDDFTKFNKGTSLTVNDTNCMPMWAHYANNHQGYCVAYDMDDSYNIDLSVCTFPIQYTDERLDITSFMKEYAKMLEFEINTQMACGQRKIQIEDLSIVYIAQYLCNIKHLSWSYEKEFRCTIAANAKSAPYIKAVPKAIYIGMKCSKKNRTALISIAKKLSIPVFQMKLVEYSESFGLEAILIEV